MSKTETLLLLTMAIMIVLMVAIIVLFVRINQLEQGILGFLSSAQAQEESATDPGLKAGEQAPAFTVPDVAGSPVSLADFSGQRVLLVFASTSCSACKEMFPHLQEFAGNHADVQIVMISNGSAEDIRQLVAQQGFRFPVLMWDNTVAGNYQVPGTPFFYVVDAQGVIASAGFANTLADLESLLAAARK